MEQDGGSPEATETSGDQGAGDQGSAGGSGGEDGLGSALTAEPGLIFDKLNGWIDGFFKLLPNLAMAAIVFCLFLGLAWLIGWLIQKSANARGRESLGAVLSGIAHWLIVIAGLMIAFTIIVPSMRVGDLVAGLGIGSVAIGFAFKDILQNLFAGILILIRQPFRTGDQIETGEGYEGTVERIEMRATLIKTYDGRRVVIPNAQVYTNAIVVNTAFDLRRSEYDFGIHYDSDTARAMDLAVEAAQGIDGVLADPGPEALSTNLGDFSKVVRLRWWTKPRQTDVVHVASEVMLAVERAFEKNGIPIPFPTQTLHLDGALDRAGNQGADRAQEREEREADRVGSGGGTQGEKPIAAE